MQCLSATRLALAACPSEVVDLVVVIFSAFTELERFVSLLGLVVAEQVLCRLHRPTRLNLLFSVSGVNDFFVTERQLARVHVVLLVLILCSLLADCYLSRSVPVCLQSKVPC